VRGVAVATARALERYFAGQAAGGGGQGAT